MELRGIGWGGVDWIDLPRYRDQWRALLNTVFATGGISRRAQLYGVS
jgi:hypothetical protein